MQCTTYTDKDCKTQAMGASAGTFQTKADKVANGVTWETTFKTTVGLDASKCVELKDAKPAAINVQPVCPPNPATALY